MTRCIYPMPEWLEESKKLYDSSFEKKLQKISGHYAYRIKAEPSWGIDKDLFQCSIMDAGKLIEMRFYTEEEAVKEADFIMAASAPVWKNILTKTDKFVAAFMARRIKLDKGNPVKALARQPHPGGTGVSRRPVPGGVRAVQGRLCRVQGKGRGVGGGEGILTLPPLHH
ncbi:MAG: hypothetical protein JRJ71_09525 [Deltaproteobacteria bacterium]|nr:hypothetical protein [Deltaproteobacteria bacterium]